MAEAIPAVQPPARFPWFALLAGLPCAIVPALLCTTGYGAYLRNGFFIAIPVLVALSFVPLYLFRVVLKAPTRSRWDAALLFIFLGFTLLSWVSGKQIRRWHCESVCARAAPAIEALQKYRTDHGFGPTRLLQVPEFEKLAERGGFSFREGRNRYAPWDAGFFEGPDLIVYLLPGDYFCMVPIERPFPMSLTRYYFLRTNSSSPTWTEDHVVWTLSGL